ncbi:H15 domain-containing protein [Citrus sinensis]|uniref:H15 domain-containing protein n=1 Tax=Citrus unshiu TaxID=55188 RepID=A0A2H5QFY5_CITUN|nr:histone H1-like [Citrus sinensis]KAH9764586.1 H15 domain-containing protein [Citrus sinensis]GAY63544.1 hypothetical protein CUMW_226470 [Citrus unshiu]
MAPVAAKTPKEGKSKNAASAATKKPRAHPPYSEMINEAITALKERTGSSQFAIAKFIEEKQKANLPNNFKKLLLVQLKKLVANGKLVKVKNSFKLPPKSSSSTAAAAAAAKKPKPSSTAATAAKKPKPSSAATAAKKPKASSTDAAAKQTKTKSKPKAKEAAVKSIKSPAKKAVAAAKVKKLKSIRSPVKKASAKKGKK